MAILPGLDEIEVEYGHVTDAAAVLRVSQPTLSRLLARAEDELGTRLFERGAGGVHPNPHGEVVLAAARDITAGMTSYSGTWQSCSTRTPARSAWRSWTR